MDKPDCLLNRILLRTHVFGISKDSTGSDVLQTFGMPEDGWMEDVFMCYEDLEIGLREPSLDAEIAYIKIYPGSKDHKWFSILNFESEPYRKICFDMGNILLLLAKNRIEFEYKTDDEDYRDEKIVVTKFGDELFFVEKGIRSYELRLAFFNSI